MNTPIYPRYLTAHQNNSLQEKIDRGFQILENCTLCGHQCKANRLKGEKGLCRAGLLPKVCSFMPHHGEEPPISGKKGSGTIFFSNCNLACVYCQNYEFSQLNEGQEVEFERLAEMMIQLQGMGVHNINWVTPTHYMPQILKSLKIAADKGLNLPIVYNTSGYETLETAKLLDGIIDIYLPDMRYSDTKMSKKYSNAPNYPEINRKNIKEAFRQVGDAQIDAYGVIRAGLIVRLLVLPDNISGTVETLRFIHKEVSPNTYISLMSQYYPYYKAKNYTQINRRISKKEYSRAAEEMKRLKLNGWIQEDYGLDSLAGVNIIKKDKL